MLRKPCEGALYIPALRQHSKGGCCGSSGDYFDSAFRPTLLAQPIQVGTAESPTRPDLAQPFMPLLKRIQQHRGSSALWAISRRNCDIRDQPEGMHAEEAFASLHLLAANVTDGSTVGVRTYGLA